MATPAIQGMEELIARLKAAPQKITSLVRAELQDGAASIASEAKGRAPADQGFLRNQIGYEQVGDLQYTVFSNAEYSPFLEFGTLEKVDIPPGLEEYAAQFKGDFASGTLGAGSPLTLKEAIFAWCQRQGIDQNLWWAIYISIAVHGIQPQPFFFPAVHRQTPIIIERVKKALEGAV